MGNETFYKDSLILNITILLLQVSLLLLLLLTMLL